MLRTSVFIPISQLRVGQRVDLYGDRYADRNFCKACANGDHGHPEFEFEFETVAKIEVETPGCTGVTFESGYACGFPPDHPVKVDTDQPESDMDTSE